jgi:hypothetical protein
MIANAFFDVLALTLIVPPSRRIARRLGGV